MKEISRPGNRFEHQKLEPLNLNVHLVTNNTLKSVCEKISLIPPDWSKLNQQFKEDSNQLLESAHGVVAELHLKNLLEKIVLSEEKLTINPISPGAEKERFAFRQSRDGRLHAINKKTKKSVVEYDAIVLADSLPVVFETKVASKISRSPSDPRSFHHALTTRRINAIFEPLQEYFSTDTFGYVILTTSEAIKPNSPVQQQFREEGGLLIPFTASRTDFSMPAQLQLLQAHFNRKR